MPMLKALKELLMQAQPPKKAMDLGLTERAYRGKGSDDQVAESGITWTTVDPEFASEYASLRGWESGEYVEPLAIRSENPVRFYHAEQRKKITEMLSEIMEQADEFTDEELAKKQWDILREKYGDSPKELNEFWQDKDVADFIRNAGFDSIRAPEGGAQGVETIGLLDKSQRRSLFAEFDPAKKDSPDILASAAPVAVAAGMGYGFASPGMAEASTQSALAPIADHPGEKYLRSRKDWDVGGYRDIPHGRLHRLANLIDKYDDTPFFDDAFGGVTDWMRGTAEVREEDSLEKAKRAGLAALDLL